MNYDYEGLLCKKCMHVGILSNATTYCEICSNKLEKVTIDLQGLIKENKILMTQDCDDDNDLFDKDIDSESLFDFDED